MGGKLAASFAFLMKLLWSGAHSSHAPTKLKSVMSMKANQFSGFAQHDAQEFMVELLDGLHEVRLCRTFSVGFVVMFQFQLTDLYCYHTLYSVTLSIIYSGCIFHLFICV